MVGSLIKEATGYQSLKVLIVLQEANIFWIRARCGQKMARDGKVLKKNFITIVDSNEPACLSISIQV